MLRLGKRPAPRPNPSAPKVFKPWRALVEAELKRCRCSYADAVSASRLPHIVDARHSVYRALSEKGVSAYQMRFVFGQHHTTILNALGRVTGKRKGKKND